MTNYNAMRQAFLAAARSRATSLSSLRHPWASGPGGEPLHVDSAVVGSAGAKAGLVIVSGIHGIEGGLGSAVQVQHLLQERASEVAILYIHLLNPWGAAWGRRVNEDNVDLNRNFIDFDAPLPENPAYEANYRFVERDANSSHSWEGAGPDVEDWVARDGFMPVMAAITSGQYERADGLFFGGHSPSWSRSVAEELIGEFCADKALTAIIDIHTGLGARGSCQVIVEGGNAQDMAEGRPGHVLAGDGASVSARLSGTLTGSVARLSRTTSSVGMVAEFGTLPARDVLRALQADHWRWSGTDRPSSALRDVAAMMEAAFHPQEQEWRAGATAECLKLIDSWVDTLESVSVMPSGRASLAQSALGEH